MQKMTTGQLLLGFASEKGHLKIVKFLCENGAEVDGCTHKGMNALMFSSIYRNFEVTKFLIDQGGADLNMQTQDGTTALIFAASNGHLKIVTLLVNNGAETNLVDKFGATALMYACEKGFFEIVKILIQKDATNLNSKDYNGSTSLMFCAVLHH